MLQGCVWLQLMFRRYCNFQTGRFNTRAAAIAKAIANSGLSIDVKRAVLGILQTEQAWILPAMGELVNNDTVT
jgi:hypothetical protein